MEKNIFLVLAVIVVVATAGCTSETGNKTSQNATGFKISSSAFSEGGMIPQKYTTNGEDVSPPLSWSSAPSGAQSFAIICEDPDSPAGNFTHWVIFDIPSNVKELAEGIGDQRTLENGAKQGINDFGSIGYMGPAPPSGTHRFYFKIYALDTKLNLEAGATKDQVLKAMEGHILAETQLMGKYGQ
ncbi:MAG: YbhB/YbcL family Raf kinase inhibitor-like protein [Euryarchaeota archaeon]|nr:YbhB/YbcL family Raf kinase inhibitor-like protein [Euryarchaeota archaeon]